MARSLMRKFREVKKKDGVPVKYTAGAAHPEARRAASPRTAEKYRKGTLTKEEMDRISKRRSKG